MAATAPPRPAQPRAHARADLNGAPLAILAVGGTVISVALALSLRTARRAERCAQVIGAAERALAAAASARAVRGVAAAGSYAIEADGARAAGFFDAALHGNVRGRVFLEARREGSSSDWSFDRLRLELDRRALAARAAQRRTAAVAAGYGKELGEVIEAQGNCGEDNDDVLVFQIAPEPQLR